MGLFKKAVLLSGLYELEVYVEFLVEYYRIFGYQTSSHIFIKSLNKLSYP